MGGHNYDAPVKEPEPQEVPLPKEEPPVVIEED